MDKKTENRYKKIKRDQKKLKDQIKKSEEELELLRLEEEEIAGQEIMAICYEQKINLLDAVKVFTEAEKTREKENKVFKEFEKENLTYGKE
ncbi:conjugal transfer protein [Clostridium sporogenes]|uniref:conjugal transfer protein n=1 Tax=Clostridium sporogenes TaxID=1509 RepID=UPI00313CD542